ncbi:MAG: hypothetical protein IJ459_06720 [Clostridia bacterium]|nr:hypothetical protein [Clostridia bacterium]
MKKISAILLALSLLISSAFLMTSCGDDGEGGNENGGSENGGDGGGANTGNEGSTKKTYTVKLLKPDGTGCADVVVKLMKDGAQVAIKRVDGNGVAVFDAERGDYTLELITVGTLSYTYNESALKIDADSTETVINFYDAPADSEYEDGMKGVTAGHYLVKLNPEGMTYFIFTAKERGEYELYSSVGDSLLDIGYYGSPHYIFEENNAPKQDGKIYLEIRKMNLESDTMEATPYLIGVKGEGATEAYIHIAKTDKVLEYTPQEMEWIDYTPSKAPTPQKIGFDNIDVVTSDLDITNPALTVVKGEDGYYHLNNASGPIVYVKITVDSPYIAAFKNINESGQFCRYFYEDGAFVKKEHYGIAMNAYIAASDTKTGLYPLDDGLKYIIQNTGEHLGWWNEGAMNYLFSELEEACDVAWLFACCTIETVSVGGIGTSPIIIGEAGELLMSAGETVKLTYTAAAGESVVFTGLPADSEIVFGEDTYRAENGKVTIFFEAGVNELTLSVGEGEKLIIKYKLSE